VKDVLVMTSLATSRASARDLPDDVRYVVQRTDGSWYVGGLCTSAAAWTRELDEAAVYDPAPQITGLRRAEHLQEVILHDEGIDSTVIRLDQAREIYAQRVVNELSEPQIGDVWACLEGLAPPTRGKAKYYAEVRHPQEVAAGLVEDKPAGPPAPPRRCRLVELQADGRFLVRNLETGRHTRVNVGTLRANWRLVTRGDHTYWDGVVRPAKETP
jgi:hypothetical protein